MTVNAARNIILALILFGCFAIAGTMDYNDNISYEQVSK